MINPESKIPDPTIAVLCAYYFVQKDDRSLLENYWTMLNNDRYAEIVEKLNTLDWDATTEGKDFWQRVIVKKDNTLFRSVHNSLNMYTLSCSTADVWSKPEDQIRLDVDYCHSYTKFIANLTASAEKIMETAKSSDIELELAHIEDDLGTCIRIGFKATKQLSVEEHKQRCINYFESIKPKYKEMMDKEYKEYLKLKNFYEN